MRWRDVVRRQQAEGVGRAGICNGALIHCSRNIGAPQQRRRKHQAAKGAAGVASFHFSAQVISRGKGRSAIAAAAYRSGARLTDERSGVDYDYRRRKGVVHTEIVAPEGAAPWLSDRGRLWNHAQAVEKRRDAQLAREINMALPHELSAEARRDLVLGFVREQFVSRGMVADVAIHDPIDGDARNHHAHVMLTLRRATAEGLDRGKTREWNSDALLNSWRENWAAHQNRMLERGGHADRVDHRTLAVQREAARGRGDLVAAATLERQPEIHVGPRAQKIARNNVPPASRAVRTAMAPWRVQIRDLGSPPVSLPSGHARSITGVSMKVHVFRTMRGLSGVAPRRLTVSLSDCGHAGLGCG